MSITKSSSRNKPCSFKENQWKNRKEHAFLMVDLIQRYNGNSSREKEDVGDDTQRKMTRTSMFKTRYQQSLKLAASEFSNETTVWYNCQNNTIRLYFDKKMLKIPTFICYSREMEVTLPNSLDRVVHSFF